MFGPGQFHREPFLSLRSKLFVNPEDTPRVFWHGFRLVQKTRHPIEQLIDLLLSLQQKPTLLTAMPKPNFVAPLGMHGTENEVPPKEWLDHHDEDPPTSFLF